MRRISTPLGQAMYMVTDAEKRWHQDVRRKLYARSREKPDYIFCELWGLVTDLRNLRMALARVAHNRGRRTPGVDGQRVGDVMKTGVVPWLTELRAELRAGTFKPQPVRRVLIPKVAQPGKFRTLGIPTVKDRVVQAAVKNILEPIFEAGFYPCSYGFRPGKSVHGALELLRTTLAGKRAKTDARRLPYQWVVEGDIKACFDSIDHHALMNRVRGRVGDLKVNRLIRAFLKAGILAEERFIRSEIGTPQGGLLSPLLANIALSVIEERYERHTWPSKSPTRLTDPEEIGRRALYARLYDRQRGKVVIYPVRYADDFLLLVGGPHGPHAEKRAREAAHKEKAALGEFLKETLGVELSESKTLVTPVTRPIRFLGHHIQVKFEPTCRTMKARILIPKERSRRLRRRIKVLFRRSTALTSLDSRLRKLNPLLRGWGYFYRYAKGAGRVFTGLDHYVWWTIFRWLKKKHPDEGVNWLKPRYVRQVAGQRSWWWHGEKLPRFRMSSIQTAGRFRLGWQTTPDFAKHSGEPDA